MTLATAPPLREACQVAHPQPKAAETWSWVFGMWLCYDCLCRLSSAEQARTPGAYLDQRELKGTG